MHAPSKLRIRMIGESLPYMIDVVVGLFEEGCYMMVIDRVVDNVPFAPRFDDATIAQKAKLVRNCRLGNPYQNGEIADAQGLLYQRIEYTGPCHICQCL